MPILPRVRAPWVLILLAGAWLAATAFARAQVYVPDRPELGPPEPAPIESDLPEAVPTDEKATARGCPKLDSRLVQLIGAADPSAFAAGAGLVYRDGAVRVVVELQASGEPSPGYGLIEEARYENLVQALAPVEQLCPLSDDTGVLFVRPPVAASPAAPSSTGRA